jgi:hypothetical protein
MSAALLGAAVIALAACGGGGTSPTTAGSDPASVAAGATASIVPTTPAPSTTAPSTTAPSTTVDVDTALAVALDAYWAGYQACGESPATCDITYLAEQGPIREITKQGFADLADRGWYFSPDRRGSNYAIQSTSVRGDQAVVESCVFDAGIVLGPNGPDGQPTVVNDEERSLSVKHTLFLEDGVWRVGQEDILVELGSGNLCAG